MQTLELVCSACGQSKPERDFPQRQGKRWGRQCKQCVRAKVKDYQTVNRQAYLEKRRRSNRNLKKQIIAQYGGVCFCCGESDDRFLSIDHIDGAGSKHRRTLGRLSSGSYFYRWLRDQGYPATMQVACFNCNFARHWNNGVCPHQEE